VNSGKIAACYDAGVEQEWGRLERNRLEFGLTVRLLDRLVPPRSRILDVGGGPGRYSFDLAAKGHKVTLFDLSAGNIRFALAHARATGLTLAGAIQGDLLNLDQFGLGTYDVLLCMGPMYHLLDEDERVRGIRLCLEALRPGGLLFVAFISAYAPLLECMRNRPEEVASHKDQLLRFLVDGRNIEGPDNPGFTDAYFIRPDAIEPFMARFPLEKITLTGVEGIPSQTDRGIYAQGEAVVQAAIDIAERTGSDPLTWASCDHLLYVGRRQ
jgi:S-adenosylmethionine-dependent methyltransferase